jgi:hypothetical protein
MDAQLREDKKKGSISLFGRTVDRLTQKVARPGHIIRAILCAGTDASHCRSILSRHEPCSMTDATRSTQLLSSSSGSALLPLLPRSSPGELNALDTNDWSRARQSAPN